MRINHNNNKNAPYFIHLSDMEAESQVEAVQSSPGTGLDLSPPGSPISNPAPLMPGEEGEEAAIPTTSDITTRRSQRISHNTGTGVWCS